MRFRHTPFAGRKYKFIAILAVVFVAETFAMWLLGTFHSSSESVDWRESLLDALLLIAFAGPFIWWIAIRPLDKALQGSHVFTQTLFDNPGTLVVVLDRAGRIVRFNPGCEEATGYAASEVVGKDLFGLLIAEDVRGKVREVFAQCIEGEFARHFQNEWLARDGSRRWISWTNDVLRDDSGRIEYVVANGLDMTEANRLRRVDNLLARFDQQVLGGRSLDDILALACAQLAQVFGYQAVWVGRKLADGRVDLLHASGSASDYVNEIRQIGVRWDDTPTGQGVTGTTIRRGEAQVFQADTDDLAPWAKTAAKFHLRSALGLPLIVRGEVFGALVLYSDKIDAFRDEESVGGLHHIGARLNVVVEAAEKQQQTQMLRLAIDTAGTGIMVTDRDGKIEWTNRALRLMTGYGESELVGANPRLFKSGQQDDEYYRHFWEALARGKTWRGETTNRRKDGSLLTVMQIVAPVRDIGGEVDHYISVTEDISLRKQAEDRIRHLAEHDALTDLPNRVLLQARLERMLAGEKRRGQQGLALLYLDIDRFKQINDTHGHDVGDALLRGFAERLCGTVRTEDTVARIGGDEFVVLLPGMEALTDAIIVAEKILAALKPPIDCLGTPLVAGSSIGIALAPDHAHDPATLLKCADTAMYAAKQAGRNTYRVFGATMAPPAA